MITEGLAKINVEGVFYNPRMKFCRDLDMLIFNALGNHEYLDALAASGVRGIRAALEAKYKPSFNDFDAKAVEVIKQNLKLNGINAEVYNKDASLLMREKKFYHIDIDPFGSPSEFVDSACFSALKYLSVTATDTAALCGSATLSGLRKYSAFAKKTEYYNEVGIRMLIGKIARELTKYDKALEVIACWTKEHYYRIHLKIFRSTSKAGKLYRKIGYLFHCFNCLNRIWLPMNGETKEMCDCGSKYTMIGPLWIGELHDRHLIKKAIDVEKRGLQRKKVLTFLERIYNEVNVPFYYDVHVLSQKIKITPPSIDRILSELKNEGYEASKTRFSPLSFKTNAEIKDIRGVLMKLG